MDDLVVVCQELAELAEAARTAQRASDVTTLGRIVQGRGSLINRCIELWPQATDAAHSEALVHLRQALEADAATLADARVWLADTHARLVHLRRGATTLQRYGASLTISRDPAKDT